MTKYPDLFAALAAPFADHEVKERPGSHGRKLHYITSRTAANRLDDVLGPENWDFEIAPWGQDALIGTLVVRLPNGEVVRKSDVGGKAAMDAGDDDTKSAGSDVFKRSAAHFGVGRYLYRDGVPNFVSERASEVAPPPEPRQEARQGHSGHQPASRPNQTPPPQPRPNQGHQGGQGGERQHDGPPRSGKALYAWVKDQEQGGEAGLLKYINGWAKLQEFPSRMIDFDAEQAAEAYAECVRKMAEVRAARDNPPPQRQDQARPQPQSRQSHDGPPQPQQSRRPAPPPAHAGSPGEIESDDDIPF